MRSIAAKPRSWQLKSSPPRTGWSGWSNASQVRRHSRMNPLSASRDGWRKNVHPGWRVLHCLAASYTLPRLSTGTQREAPITKSPSWYIVRSALGRYASGGIGMPVSISYMMFLSVVLSVLLGMSVTYKANMYGIVSLGRMGKNGIKRDARAYVVWDKMGRVSIRDPPLSHTYAVPYICHPGHRTRVYEVSCAIRIVRISLCGHHARPARQPSTYPAGPEQLGALSPMPG